MTDELHTVSAVIDALGGTASVARLFGIEMSAVSNWRSEGLPPARQGRLWLECEKLELRPDQRLFPALFDVAA